MINGKRILAVIPARGGSKGVPRKNIRNVAGKPLVAWTIESALGSKYIDRVILTSEDQEIIDTARAWGCEVPFTRPASLAQDDTPGIDPVLHAIEELPGYDYIVLLQPTSPLRTAADIDACLELCMQQAAPACVSVVEPDKSPFWMFRLTTGDRMEPLLPREKAVTRRQDAPVVFALNGAIYVAEAGWLVRKRIFVTEETVGFIMPKGRSLDIDTEIDLRLCELLLQERICNGK